MCLGRSISYNSITMRSTLRAVGIAEKSFCRGIVLNGLQKDQYSMNSRLLRIVKLHKTSVAAGGIAIYRYSIYVSPAQTKCGNLYVSQFAGKNIYTLLIGLFQPLLSIRSGHHTLHRVSRSVFCQAKPPPVAAWLRLYV